MEPNEDETSDGAEPGEARGDAGRLASGAGVILLGKLGGRGTHQVLQIVLARTLGPAAFGLYALGWTVVRIACILFTLGLNNGVLRFGAGQRRNAAGLRAVLVQSTGLSFLAGSASGIILLALSPVLAEHVFGKPELVDVLRLFALSLPFMTALRVVAAATRISQRMKYSVYTEEAGQPVSNMVLVVVLFVAFGATLAGAVWAVVLSCTLAAALGWIYIRRLFPEAFATRERVRSMSGRLLAYSLPTAFAGMFSALLAYTARIVLGIQRPETDVGVYQAASQLTVALAIILHAFSTILAPMTAHLSHAGEHGRLNEVYRLCTKWGIYVALPPAMVFCLAREEVIEVLFGQAYLPGATALLILTLGQMAHIGAGSVGPLLVMTGHERTWMLTSAGMLGGTIVLNLVLIPIYGLNGAALATSIGIGCAYFVGLLQARRLLGIRPYDRRYVKGLAAMFVGAVVLFCLRHIAYGTPGVRLGVAIVVAMVIPTAVLILLGPEEEDIEFLRVVGGFLRRGRGSGTMSQHSDDGPA